MAVTVTTDLVNRHTNDAITNTAIIGGINAPTITDTAIKVQGTGTSRARSNATGVGGTACNFTNANLTGLHVFGWVNNLDKADTKANGGWRLRIAANGAATTAFGEWICGGSDAQLSFNAGFFRFCADAGRPFNFVTGTPAALTGIGMIATVTNQLSASSRETWFIDSQDTATYIRIAGGTTGSKGNAAEVAADDDTNGRGMFVSVGGAFYILGKLFFGPASAVASEYLDLGQVFIFQDQPVSATFHYMEFVGGAAVTNNAIFGSKSGSGITAEGTGGNTFKAGGLAPFTVKAVDSNINVGLYGCVFINPTAAVQDAPRAVQYATAAGVFTNVTRAAGNSTANDFLVMPAAEATGDYCVYGHNEPFSSLKLNIGTAGTVGTVTWEYWNGSAWTALTDVTDGTNSYKTSGTNSVTYAIPDDWATTTLNSLGPHYYIRSKVTATYTVNPNGTQCWCVMGGRVRLEASTVEALRCIFTNMDTIRVRNGALLRKCVISSSTAPAKSAALDLGSADPTANSVRDLTIQSCATGILLKGTSTGTTTYNFRAIQFASNTKDVRVDFPAAATVVINVLENGTTPTIDNVNGSTVTVVNAVEVKLTVLNASTSAALQNARVLLEAGSGGPLPYQAPVTITRASTTATVAHTAHGLATGNKVVIRGAAQQEYNGVYTITVTGANAYTYTVSGTPATPATGTIVSTGVILSGLTDASGVIQDTGFNFVSAQAVTGKARLSTGSFYKTGQVSGSITSAGFTTTVFLVPD